MVLYFVCDFKYFSNIVGVLKGKRGIWENYKFIYYLRFEVDCLKYY